MEWIQGNRPQSQSLQAFFAHEFDQEDESRKFELLDLACIGRKVCYGAYRFTNKETGEQRISALVIGVRFPHGDHNIAYRMTTEYDGPTDYHCPKRIYALLTRFKHCEESPRAIAWRHRVETWHRAMDNVPTLRAGMKLQFRHPVRFDNGDTQSEFVVQSARPLLLRGENDALYRIAHLRDRIGRGDAQIVA